MGGGAGPGSLQALCNSQLPPPKFLSACHLLGRGAEAESRASSSHSCPQMFTRLARGMGLLNSTSLRGSLSAARMLRSLMRTGAFLARSSACSERAEARAAARAALALALLPPSKRPVASQLSLLASHCWPRGAAAAAPELLLLLGGGSAEEKRRAALQLPAELRCWQALSSSCWQERTKEAGAMEGTTVS